MNTQELKQQARKEFKQTFSPQSYPHSIWSEGNIDQVNMFLDSLIDKTVQQERDRIVTEIMQKTLDAWFEAQTLSFNVVGEPVPDVNLDKMGKILLKKISLITNKSDINK